MNWENRPIIFGKPKKREDQNSTSSNLVYEPHKKEEEEEEKKNNAIISAHNTRVVQHEPLVATVVPETQKSPEEEYSIFEDKETIDVLYERAQKRVLLGAPDLNDFREVYGDRIVDDDLQYIQDKEASFDNDPEAKYNKKISTITEALLADCIARYGWFGDAINIYQPSVYDDYRNGADVVFEFNVADSISPETHNFLGAGIDVALGGSTKRLESKVDMSYERMLEGQLSKIKYFVDKNENPVEKLYMPHFVIVISEEEAQELMLLWKNNDKEGLRKHPFKSSLVLQVYTQSEEWIKEAQKNKQENIAEAYERTLSLTNNMIINKIPGMRTAFMDVNKNAICNKMKHVIRTSQARFEKKQLQKASQSYQKAA